MLCEKPMAKVAGIGEILYDVLPEGKQLGGAPSNFVFHAKALGLDAHLVTAVGNDRNGGEICEKLRSAGISLQYVQHVPFPTGTVQVTLDPGGIASYRIKKEVAWDHILWSDDIQKLASEVDAVCFGTLAQRSIQSYQSIQNFLTHTKKDCLKVFDINLRQTYFSREIIESSLQKSNILKLNREELEVIKNLFNLPKSDTKALRVLLEQYRLHFIALTQGPAGSIIADQKNSYYCPAFPAAVQDTIGAGDSFTAAMILGKLRGLPLDQINQLASRVAAYVCSQAGATPTLPPSLISELMQESPIRIQTVHNPASLKKCGLNQANSSAL